MAAKNKDDRMTRRRFIGDMGRGASFLVIGGTVGMLATRSRGEDMVWQIDPFKCTACGRCATHCVLDLSAVKCRHAHPMCGYCRLCFGFFKTNAIEMTEGAENQMCPLGAIQREYIEDPYYEYQIDEDLCNACGKCVKGCNAFGNGSLYLQVRHDLCLNCADCNIAANCPAEAFVRLPASAPYIDKELGPEQLEGNGGV
jgi:electron transport complex protein RnfB